MDESHSRNEPSALNRPPITAVRTAVSLALDEDLTPIGDVTSALLPAGSTATAKLTSRASGVLAGCDCVSETFRALDNDVVIDWHLDDGSPVEPGSVIADVSGPLASLLTGERTALNFLGHLSGIATLAAHFVEILAASGDTRLKVWDTRKTTPGLRALEKAAVRAGGAQNHRGNLSEWVMFKDNHLALIGIGEAVHAARQSWPGRLVHVECDHFEQLVAALDAGADAVLLDNMSPEQVRTCVSEVDRRVPYGQPGRCLIEISGGISAKTLPDFAHCGADRVSVGAITNSAPVLDIGLDIVVKGPT